MCQLIKAYQVMDTRISVVFASLCNDLSQDLGRYEWRRSWQS